MPHQYLPIPALIDIAAAAKRLGVSTKRFRAAVAAGQVGQCRLIQLLGTHYVHTAFLNEFLAVKPTEHDPFR